MDRTTTVRRPAATTTRAAGTRTATATTTRRPARTTAASATLPRTTTTTTGVASPTPTETPTSGGMSGGAIGGIIAGFLVAIAAVVGLLFYKRRRRGAIATVKDGKSDTSLPSYQAPQSGPGISGPLALAPDSGVKDGGDEKKRLPEAQYNENKHFQPGMRDELFALPGKGPQNNGPNNNGNKGPGGDGGAPGMNYYDDGLVQDYYGSPPPGEPPIGAQQPMHQPSNKSLHQGNQTPLPGQVNRQDSHGAGRRGSSASDASDGSGFLTYEEAQLAHNRKMMGHKQSIGSEADLDKYKNQPPQYQQQPQSPSQPQQQPPNGPYQSGESGGKQYGNLLSPTDARFGSAPEHQSIAMTESTVSMMPALPPSATPLPTGKSGSGGGGPSPYAESAFSDEYDDRSQLGSYYNGDQSYGGYQNGGSPQYYNNHPMSPPYSPYGNNHNAYPPRGGPPPTHYPQRSPPYGGGGGGGYRPGPPPNGGGYQSSPMMHPYPGGGSGGGGGRPPMTPQQRPSGPPQRSNGPTGLGPLMQHDPHNPFPPRVASPAPGRGGSPHQQPYRGY